MTDRISESVSSFASIAGRATPEQWRKMLAMNWTAATAHIEGMQSVADSFRKLTETLGSVTPAGAFAGLSAGIARPRCGCGKPNDRWKPGAKDSPRSCSECNREHKRKSDARKRDSDKRRDQELENARAELARLKRPAE